METETHDYSRMPNLSKTQIDVPGLLTEIESGKLVILTEAQKKALIQAGHEKVVNDMTVVPDSQANADATASTRDANTSGQ